MSEELGDAVEHKFTRLSAKVASATGRAWAFALCVVSVVIWAVTGPLMGFSEVWQLIINTGTTIVTFLMVFLIQNTQNRHGVALQVKLDELIRSGRALNEFVGIEHLAQAEIDEIIANRKAKETATRTAPTRRPSKRTKRTTKPSS